LGAALVPAGVILMLTGLAGDLISIVLGGSGHAGEPFVSFAHPDPWRLVMFAGVILAAVGAIRWAIGQRTEWGGLAGAMISLLLVATVALGGWAAVRGSPRSVPARREAAQRVPVVVHVHSGHAHGATLPGGLLLPGEHH